MDAPADSVSVAIDAVSPDGADQSIRRSHRSRRKKHMLSKSRSSSSSNLVSSSPPSYRSIGNHKYTHDLSYEDIDSTDSNDSKRSQSRKLIVQEIPRPRSFTIKQNISRNKGVIFSSVLFIIIMVLLGTYGWKEKFGFDAWATLCIVYCTFIALFKGWGSLEVVMMINTTSLLLLRIITPAQALVGFANPAVFSIAVLFIVASGVQRTGSLQFLLKYIFKSPKHLWQAQLRLLLPIAAISPFINNTPLVAMLIPVVLDWSKKIRIPPSKLMIPLSFGTILGGTCTLIGTSTNLIVMSFLNTLEPDQTYNLFEIGMVGFPLSLVGITYIVVMSRWLLPDRSRGLMKLLHADRVYHVSVKVNLFSDLIGKTKMTGDIGKLTLTKIERKGDPSINPTLVPETTDISFEDTLTYRGAPDDIKELFRYYGLTPLDFSGCFLRQNRKSSLVEVAISESSALIGKSIRKTKFLARYGASIIACCRPSIDGPRTETMTLLYHGDCLLLDATDDFLARFNVAESVHSRDLLVLQQVRLSDQDPVEEPRDVRKMIFAPLAAIAMVALNATGTMPLMVSSLTAAFAMLLTGCVTLESMRKAVDVPLIVTIAGSFGMAAAIEKTGIALEVSHGLVSTFHGFGDIGILFAIYICTMLLTSVLSNASGIAIMFPIVYNIGSLSLKSRMYILMYAASADFLTPIGYQTNLMVYKHGGYEFLDYTKFGGPLQALLCVCSVMLTHLLFS